MKYNGISYHAVFLFQPTIFYEDFQVSYKLIEPFISSLFASAEHDGCPDLIMLKTCVIRVLFKYLVQLLVISLLKRECRWFCPPSCLCSLSSYTVFL